MRGVVAMVVVLAACRPGARRGFSIHGKPVRIFERGYTVERPCHARGAPRADVIAPILEAVKAVLVPNGLPTLVYPFDADTRRPLLPLEPGTAQIRFDIRTEVGVVSVASPSEIDHYCVHVDERGDEVRIRLDEVDIIVE